MCINGSKYSISFRRHLLFKKKIIKMFEKDQFYDKSNFLSLHWWFNCACSNINTLSYANFKLCHYSILKQQILNQVDSWQPVVLLIQPYFKIKTLKVFAQQIYSPRLNLSVLHYFWKNVFFFFWQLFNSILYVSLVQEHNRKIQKSSLIS